MNAVARDLGIIIVRQEERRLKTPRSETQLSHEIGVTLENGLDWLAKIFEWKAVQEQKSE